MEISSITPEQAQLAAKLLAAKLIFDAVGSREAGDPSFIGELVAFGISGEVESAILDAMENMAYKMIGKAIKFNSTLEIIQYAQSKLLYEN